MTGAEKTAGAPGAQTPQARAKAAQARMFRDMKRASIGWFVFILGALAAHEARILPPEHFPAIAVAALVLAFGYVARAVLRARRDLLAGAAAETGVPANSNRPKARRKTR